MLPYHLCEKLLKCGANASSSFSENESALHIAVRLKSKNKIKLLVHHNANSSLRWLGKTPLEYAISQSCDSNIISILKGKHEIENINCSLNPFDSVLHLDQTRYFISAKEFQSMAFQCYQSPLEHQKSQEIGALILSLAKAISSEIGKSRLYSRYRFEPFLGGSMAEGSKTFFPDEYDLTTIFNEMGGVDLSYGDIIPIDKNSVWREESNEQLYLVPRKVAQTFYAVVRKIINSMDKYAFAPLLLSDHPFDTRNKISRLKLIWCENNDNGMDIYVDLAPAFRTFVCPVIAKQPRRITDNKVEEYESTSFHWSDAESMRCRLLKMPLEARQGLLIAKAARISGICNPGNLRALDLCENIDSTSVITSYELKKTLLEVADNPNKMRNKLLIEIAENPFEYYSFYKLKDSGLFDDFEYDDIDMRFYTITGRELEKMLIDSKVKERNPYKWAEAIYADLKKQSGDPIKKKICSKILEFLKVNRFEFRELSKDLKRVQLIPLKYGHRMSQMMRVYQRPAVTNQRAQDNITIEYACKRKDYSIEYEKMFNSEFHFKSECRGQCVFKCTFDRDDDSDDSDDYDFKNILVYFKELDKYEILSISLSICINLIYFKIAPNCL